MSEFVDENPNKEYNAYQPKEDIVLYADKAYITEGDFVLVSWQCYSSNIDIVTLQLDNGYKLLNYSIDANGQKEFKISVFRNVLKISIIYRKGNIQDVKVLIGIIIYAIIAYITCPRKENGSFEEGAIALYIIVPVVVLAIYLICNN